jgi:phenylacetate-CoA ligase
LVTGLAQGATPFFRHRIGDSGTRSKKPCPCGRAGDVFIDVDGRDDDYVTTLDGRLVGRLDHIFKGMRDVTEAQILQDNRNEIEVLIVPKPEYDNRSEQRLVRQVRVRLGDEIIVKIRQVREIAREKNGKFRAVKSSLLQNQS